MSREAETIRRAITLMRETVKRAPSGPWSDREAEGWNRDSRRTLGTYSVVHDGQQEIALVRGFSKEREGTAAFISSWDPTIVLLVADLIDRWLSSMEALGGTVTDPRLWERPTPKRVLVLAQTFLGEQDCDHERTCCREHGTHSSPHVGCILR